MRSTFGAHCSRELAQGTIRTIVGMGTAPPGCPRLPEHQVGWLSPKSRRPHFHHVRTYQVVPLDQGGRALSDFWVEPNSPTFGVPVPGACLGVITLMSKVMSRFPPTGICSAIR